MPNWTNVRVNITAPKNVMDKFIADGILTPDAKKLDGHDYTFESWVPMPKTYKDFDTTNHPYGEKIGAYDMLLPVDGIKTKVTAENRDEIVAKYKEATEYQEKTYGIIGWYDWARINWGCKWDAGFDIDRLNDTEAEIYLVTPWCEPSAFFAEISSRYGEDMVISIFAHDEYPWNKVVDICNGSVSSYEPDTNEITEYFEDEINNNDDWTPEQKEKYLQYAHDFIEGDSWDCTECEAYNYDEFVDWYIDGRSEDTQTETSCS